MIAMNVIRKIESDNPTSMLKSLNQGKESQVEIPIQQSAKANAAKYFVLME
jgi:hypothetical protein